MIQQDFLLSGGGDSSLFLWHLQALSLKTKIDIGKIKEYSVVFPEKQPRAPGKYGKKYEQKKRKNLEAAAQAKAKAKKGKGKADVCVEKEEVEEETNQVGANR